MSQITEEIESCDFEPPDFATLEPKTNIGKSKKKTKTNFSFMMATQILHTYIKQNCEKYFLHRCQLKNFGPIFHHCRLDSSIYES